MFKVASWNLNSVRSRLTHVTTWLQVREPDVLLLQELKGTEFPSEVFNSLGYESVAVTQKAYNGVAILSRHPMKAIAKALVGEGAESLFGGILRMNGRPQIRECMIRTKMQRWCLIARHGFVDRSCPPSRARRNYWRLVAKYPQIAAELGLSEVSVYPS
jgi:exonuclease III